MEYSQRRDYLRSLYCSLIDTIFRLLISCHRPFRSNGFRFFFFHFRVTVKQESTPDGVVAQLQISSAEASDSGAYFCQASNLYGRDQQLVQLLVQGLISSCYSK